MIEQLLFIVELADSMLLSTLEMVIGFWKLSSRNADSVSTAAAQSPWLAESVDFSC
jgi:hypothetical protein